MFGHGIKPNGPQTEKIKFGYIITLADYSVFSIYAKQKLAKHNSTYNNTYRHWKIVCGSGDGGEHKQTKKQIRPELEIKNGHLTITQYYKAHSSLDKGFDQNYICYLRGIDQDLTRLNRTLLVG